MHLGWIRPRFFVMHFALDGLAISTVHATEVTLDAPEAIR